MTDGPASSPTSGKKLCPVRTGHNDLGQAYTLTCDSGHCDDLTVAIVLGVDGLWLSMCKKHAGEELVVL